VYCTQQIVCRCALHADDASATRGAVWAQQESQVSRLAQRLPAYLLLCRRRSATS